MRVVPLHDRSSSSFLAPLVPRWLASSGARTFASFPQAPTLVRLSSTDSLVRLPARAPLQHFLSCASQAQTGSSASQASLSCSASQAASSLVVLFSSTCASQAASPVVLCLPSTHTSFSLRPALFWSRSIRTRQSGGHATPPPASPRFGNREMMSLWWGGPCGVLAGNLAAATPRLHPSRGERDHTVLVRWRVPLRCSVGVGEVASSRAWCERGV